MISIISESIAIYSIALACASGVSVTIFGLASSTMTAHTTLMTMTIRASIAGPTIIVMICVVTTMTCVVVMMTRSYRMMWMVWIRWTPTRIPWIVPWIIPCPSRTPSPTIPITIWRIIIVWRIVIWRVVDRIIRTVPCSKRWNTIIVDNLYVAIRTIDNLIKYFSIINHNRRIVVLLNLLSIDKVLTVAYHRANGINLAFVVATKSIILVDISAIHDFGIFIYHNLTFLIGIEVNIIIFVSNHTKRANKHH